MLAHRRITLPVLGGISGAVQDDVEHQRALHGNGSPRVEETARLSGRGRVDHAAQQAATASAGATCAFAPPSRSAQPGCRPAMPSILQRAPSNTLAMFCAAPD